MSKTFTDAELNALPERSALADHCDVMTDPATGITIMMRRPRRFFVSDCNLYGFFDAAGVAYTLGKDEDGYFKSRVW